MLRIAGRRYDRKLPRWNHFSPTSTASASTAAAAAAAATAGPPHRHHDAAVESTETRSSRNSSSTTRRSSVIHSRPLFAASDRTSRLTRLPTPLPPDAIEKKMKEVLDSSKARTGSSSSTSATLVGKQRANNSSGSASVEPNYTQHQMDTLRSIFFDQAIFPTAQTVEALAVLRTSLDAGLIWRAGKVFDDIRQDERTRWNSIARYQHTDSGTGPSSSSHIIQSETTAKVLRESRKLDKQTYDDMLQAYLLKAAVGENPAVKREFFQRAMQLFEDMLQNLLDDGGNPASGDVAALAVAKATTSSRGALADIKLGRTGEPAADAATAAILLRGYAR